jgi:hypothetical protein
MMNLQFRDLRIVSLLEDAICTQELTLTCKLAAGLDTSAEQAALAELHQRLRIAHHFQAHQANQSSRWLRQSQ